MNEERDPFEDRGDGPAGTEGGRILFLYGEREREDGEEHDARRSTV